MRTELILGTLDPVFDRAILNYEHEMQKGNGTPLLKQGDEIKPINIFFIENSFNELLQPQYLFGASRELLDDTQNRYTKIQHRHLIPYIPVTCGDKIALYSRTAKGTEGQLHGKLSVGFGGHIELSECCYFGDDLITPLDNIQYKKDTIDLPSTLTSSVLRELEEEFGITETNITGSDRNISYEQQVQEQYGLRKHAIIVSNAAEVDKRHLALLYRVDVKDISVLEVEDQLNLIGWFTLEEIREKYFDDLEMWSKAVVSLESLTSIPKLF